MRFNFFLLLFLLQFVTFCSASTFVFHLFFNMILKWNATIPWCYVEFAPKRGGRQAKWYAGILKYGRNMLWLTALLQSDIKFKTNESKLQNARTLGRELIKVVNN